MRIMLQLLLMLLPWALRRPLLCALFGYEIAPSARIGLSLIDPWHLKMGRLARIGHLTVCKRIDSLILNDESGMGSLNFITGFSTRGCRHFKHVPNRKCELVLGRGVGLTGRKFLDCNGGIYVGEYSTIAGLWSQFLTHSIDIYHSRQHAAPISIGKYCFVGSGCIILPGSTLPDYSVLGAGSVLNKQFSGAGYLYAGCPASPRKKLDPEAIPWMQRTTLGVT